MDDREREVTLRRAECIVSDALIRAGGRFPFFSYLLYSLPIVPSWDVLTADVDGRRIRYNPGFIVGLYDAFGEDGVVWVLSHEVLHPALGHLWRGEGLDQERWNIACDVVVNEVLSECGLPVPHDFIRASTVGIYPFNFQLSEEEIYWRLVSFASTAKDRLGKDIVRPSREDPSSSSSSSQSGEHEGDRTSRPAPSPHEWADRLRRAVEHARQRGRLPTGLHRAFGLDEPSRVDWRSVVARYITSSRDDYDWRTFDRRMLQHGVYFPDLRSERVVIVVAVDTSGSIEDKQLSSFVSEVIAISRVAPNVEGFVLTCDAAVHDVVPFDSFSPTTFKPRGGGGTDFRPVFSWIEDSGCTPAVLVYLTDGEGVYPESEPTYPVVWVIHRTDNAKVEPPFGEVVRP